ncbi:REP-associated tyrosine transposase [Pelovirga terrestris]|uniref:Transposase n=1 Tax=Pelovirga terrestris TaxID=2771352 RepID=A0A8J6UL81_9BACT|nr:transposase [Pelovirga terrestris]MBD1400772.1 transposase [Pelovirga terrestris]
MSRPLRIEFSGAWYHAMNRGRRRENIFLQSDDFEAFLNIVRESADRWNVHVAAYCLLSNHYHLLLQTPEGNLARCMRHINGVYTQRFNRIHGQDGQLFRGRYKAVLVEDDSHLLEVMRYIHRNPLNAGLVRHLDEYPWSSHTGYLSCAKQWNWLERETLLTMLTTKKSQRKQAYLDFVSQNEPQQISSFYAMKKLASLLGGEAFRDWVSHRFVDLELQREIPEAKKLANTPQGIIVQVCAYFDQDEARLRHSRRGIENLPRDIAIYLARSTSRMTLGEIGAVFGVANYSTVSSAAERIKIRMAKDARLRQDVESLKQLLAKSQR